MLKKVTCMLIIAISIITTGLMAYGAAGDVHWFVPYSTTGSVRVKNTYTSQAEQYGKSKRYILMSVSKVIDKSAGLTEGSTKFVEQRKRIFGNYTWADECHKKVDKATIYGWRKSNTSKSGGYKYQIVPADADFYINSFYCKEY